MQKKILYNDSVQENEPPIIGQATMVYNRIPAVRPVKNAKVDAYDCFGT